MPHAQTQGVRQQQDGQRHQRQEDEEDRQRKALAFAERVDRMRQQADRDQVSAGEQQNDGTVERGVREIHLGSQQRIANQRDDDQPPGDHHDPRSHRGERTVDRREQHRLAQEINLCGEPAADPEHHVLGLPPLAAARRAQRALELAEHQHGSDHQATVEETTGPAERQHRGHEFVPIARDREHRVAEQRGESHRHHEHCRDGPSPAVDELAIVRPSEAQAEEQPQSRSRREAEQA